MAFRYEEIGQRLKAFRMGSGLGADEIARKIGISRTALYRFERGELAKIDTLAKFAELLGVSTATLLGVGIEYIPSAVSYFERMRQIEETAEQIVILSGPISFLLASDDFQATLQEVLTENITKAVANPARALSDIPLIMEILAQRKELYRKRRPAIVNLMSAFELERFLDHGFVGRKGMTDEVLRKRKALARAEIEHFARLLERQPIGVQIGIVPDTLPHTGFQLFRHNFGPLLAVTFRQRLQLIGEGTLDYRLDMVQRRTRRRGSRGGVIWRRRHVHDERLAFRVDLNPVETSRAIGSGVPHNPRR
jgi:transcriptional regulator with XRE-family HTH domain